MEILHDKIQIIEANIDNDKDQPLRYIFEFASKGVEPITSTRVINTSYEPCRAWRRNPASLRGMR